MTRSSAPSSATEDFRFVIDDPDPRSKHRIGVNLSDRDSNGYVQAKSRPIGAGSDVKSVLLSKDNIGDKA